jgi:peptidoglycan/LPS O-acetylase OafA/YrhL
MKNVDNGEECAPALPKPGTHISTLDGVRGLAIIGVLIFHLVPDFPAIYSALPGGLTVGVKLGQKGVDLFFVLSGFLITGILMDTRNNPHRWRNFFVRRGLRIFPLYFLTLIVVYNLAPGFFHTTGLREHQGWLWLYLQNFGSDFGFCPNFGHFWSLAVEEQFYLVWPFLIWSCPTAKSVRNLCLVTIVLAFLTRLYFVNQESIPTSILFCRMDTLAGGGFLAATLRMGKVSASIWRRRCVFGTLTTGLICLPMYVAFSGTGSGVQQVWKFSAYAVLFTSFVGWAIVAPETSFLAKLLNSRVLAWFGKYSYALYVFHPFVGGGLNNYFAISDSVSLQMLQLTTVLGISMFTARVSWSCLESPIHSLKRFFPSSVLPITLNKVD